MTAEDLSLNWFCKWDLGDLLLSARGSCLLSGCAEMMLDGLKSPGKYRLLSRPQKIKCLLLIKDCKRRYLHGNMIQYILSGKLEDKSSCKV